MPWNGERLALYGQAWLVSKPVFTFYSIDNMVTNSTSDVEPSNSLTKAQRLQKLPEVNHSPKKKKSCIVGE